MSHGLLCCECGGGGGTSTESHRLKALIPCGHLVHESCAEFQRKKSKLLAYLGADDVIVSGGQTLNSSLCCPQCGAGVTGSVALFIQEADAKDAPDRAMESTSASGRNDTLQSRVFHIQRKHLVKLKECGDHKAEFLRRSANCAKYHMTKALLTKRLDEIQQSIADAESAAKKYDAALENSKKQVDAIKDGSVEESYLMQMNERMLREYLGEATASQRRLHKDLEAAKHMLSSRNARLEALKKCVERARVETAKLHAVETVKARTLSLRPSEKGLNSVVGCSSAPMMGEDANDDGWEEDEQFALIVADASEPSDRVKKRGRTRDEAIDVDIAVAPLTTRQNPVVIDSDSEDDDDDDEVMVVGSTAPIKVVPLLKAIGIASQQHTQQSQQSRAVAGMVPHGVAPMAPIGRGTGRSLWDFPRPVDARVQTRLDDFSR